VLGWFGDAVHFRRTRQPGINKFLRKGSRLSQLRPPSSSVGSWQSHIWGEDAGFLACCVENIDIGCNREAAKTLYTRGVGAAVSSIGLLIFHSRSA
jgi:hypothetical protein